MHKTSHIGYSCPTIQNFERINHTQLLELSPRDNRLTVALPFPGATENYDMLTKNSDIFARSFFYQLWVVITLISHIFFGGHEVAKWILDRFQKICCNGYLALPPSGRRRRRDKSVVSRQVIRPPALVRTDSQSSVDRSFVPRTGKDR